MLSNNVQENTQNYSVSNLRENVHNVVVLNDDRVQNFICTKVLSLSSLPLDVTAFTSPPEAVEFIEKHHLNIDLLVLDVKLPGYSGTDLAKYLYDKNIRTPIVLYSALPEDQLRELVKISPNISGYIEKSLSISKLAELEPFLPGISSLK